MTGRAGFTLIASQSKKVNIPDSCLKLIGEFSIYVNDSVMPMTPFADVYESQNEEELKYLRMFAEQLKLDKEHGRDRFWFAAVTILINNHLTPHVDSMNPREDNDYTMAFSLVIPLNEVPSDVRSVLLSIIRSFSDRAGSLTYLSKDSIEQIFERSFVEIPSGNSKS